MKFTFLRGFGGRQSAERKQRARTSGNYSGNTFRNLEPTRTIRPGTFWKMLRQYLLGKEIRVPRRVLPTVKRVRGDYASAPAGAIRTTWIGHSSTLVEFDGMRILTDPIWSERSSPVSWFGPKRFFPPPLALEDVPELDVVLISHDHYDHLDMRTIEELSKRNVKFVMPLGVGAHLEAWGVRPENIVELNWYESVQLAELNITLVSARHFSGRHLVDRDRTLWGAFVVEGVNHKIFYAGDSGSSGCFEEIGEKYGPFDLAIMQIGAYSENWAEIHMTPEEALQAHLAVKGKLFLPVHWGTFNLAIHSWNDPAKRLAKAAQEMGIDFRIPQPGEFVYSDRDHSLPSDKWWSEE